MRCAPLGPLLLLTACGGEAPPRQDTTPPLPLPVDVLEPPTARWAQVEEFERDLAAIRHASDGGGSARIVVPDGEVPRAVAGTRGSWTIEYTAGVHGIAPGGVLFFMPEPFWGWSPPQVHSDAHLGYTTFETRAAGVELAGETLPAMVAVTVGGRALAEGETITLVYGAGPGALADRHSERGAHLWVAVDGDGDGVRQVLADSPTVDVLPGPPEMLVATVSSVVRPGETARLTLAVLDVLGNAGLAVDGEVELLARPAGWAIPARVPLDGTDRATLEFACPDPGILRLSARITLGDRTLEAEANPLWVSATAPRVRWADLHGHSNYSDGTGLPESWFSYARDVAQLDIAALTDHDHFGVLFLDQHPALFEDVREQVRRFHAPGRFVTLLGYEWTSWIHGHRHVVYFSDEGELHSSLDPAVRTPRQLWDALRGQAAMTFAHHSSGEPVATNWSFAPDPELEPVTEVCSVHGSSEAADGPGAVRGSLRGNFVRDQLDRGYRLGFIGSGDGHDGHPGLSHRDPVYGYRPETPRGPERLGAGGLAAVLCEELTRAGVQEALAARRCYATNGPRILLDARLGGAPQGAALRAGALAGAQLTLVAVGTAPFTHLDVVRSGEVSRMPLAGRRELDVALPLAALAAGEYVYLRLFQEDGGVAFTSPFFVDE
jgi:hypothetical protein